MSPSSELNLFNAIIILGVTAPTIYLGIRVKARALKILSVLLPAFLLVHGLYHLFSFMGEYFDLDLLGRVGNDAFGPLSYILLFVFVVYFARRGG